MKHLGVLDQKLSCADYIEEMTKLKRVTIFLQFQKVLQSKNTRTKRMFHQLFNMESYCMAL